MIGLKVAVLKYMAMTVELWNVAVTGLWDKHHIFSQQEGFIQLILDLAVQQTAVGRCLNFISIAVTKNPDKSSVVENGFVLAHSSRFQSIIVRKSQWQELETTDHIASIVKKQRGTNYYMHTCAQFSLSTLIKQLSISYLGNGFTHHGQVFLAQLMQSR